MAEDRYDDDLGEEAPGRSGPSARGPRRSSKPRKVAVSGCGPRCVGRQNTPINYKEVRFLQNYVTRHAKIRPRRQTSNCAKHQRLLAREIKRARHMALLPFAPGQEPASD